MDFRPRYVYSFFILIAIIATAGFGYGQKSTSMREILVWVQPGVRAEDLTHSLYAIKGIPDVASISRVGLSLPVFRVRLRQEDRFGEMLERLQNSPLIVHAGYNGYVHLRRVPNDPKFSQQWAMKKIMAPQAWDLATGEYSEDNPIVIAVLDAGFEREHEDLKDQIWRNEKELPGDNIDNDNNGYTDDYFGYNTLYNSDTLYEHSHGTKVAGIIGASGNNGRGIAGVNWNARIMTVSFGQADNISDADVLEGMEYILRQRQAYNASNGREGAYVVAVNMSLGRPRAKVSTFQGICRMMDVLGEAGILTIGATSNEDINVDVDGDLPCDCGSEYLICVTSTDQQDEKNKGAGYGEKSIDLGAPGSAVLSTTHSDKMSYSTGSGTSFSAPLVSGAVGLLYSAPCTAFQSALRDTANNPPLLVRDFILEGVDKNSRLQGITATGGRLNLFRSLALLKSQYCPQVKQELTIHSISPNPAQKVLRIRYGVGEYTLHTLRLVGIGGNILVEQVFWPGLNGEEERIIEVSPLVPGTYIVHLFNDYEQVSRKVVIRP